MPDDFNAVLFEKLYSKLSLALGVTYDKQFEDLYASELGRPPTPRSATLSATDENAQVLLAIYNPGQYLPANLDPETKAMDRYALSVLLNKAPKFLFRFASEGINTVPSVYESILDYHEAPLTKLSPEQREKLDAARVWLEEDDHYVNYRKYQLDYYVVADEYDAALATQSNGGATVPRSLKARLDAAWNDWVVLGHKPETETRLGTIQQLAALDPDNFWEELRNRFDDGTQRAGTYEFQNVGVSPPYSSWFKDPGWTSFAFDNTDMDNQQRSQAIGVAGTLGLEFGIFRVSGSGNYEQDSKYVKMDQTDLTFRANLMRVSLDRSWMNPIVLFSRAWQWGEGTPAVGTEISSGGDIAAGLPATGIMTAVPTAVILSKDVVITGKFDNTLVEEFNRDIRAEASVGIGPFTVAGQFEMEEHTGYQKGTISTTGITAPDVQIIAVVCEILPKLPNPDPALPWPPH